MDDMSNNGRDFKGLFLPGHAGEKKKGMPEFQRAAREKLGRFLVSRLDDLDAIYKKLTPSRQEKMLMTITEFFLPRQREIFIDDQPKATIDYSRLSESTLKEILAATTIEEDHR